MIEFNLQHMRCTESISVWILRSTPLSRIRRDVHTLETNGVAELSVRDSDRWQRYRSIPKKNQFLMSRRAISLVLTEEFGVDHHVSWQSSQSGCPQLLDIHGQDVATVSLSHSENVVVIAIDWTCQPIGVDCEVVSSVVPKAVVRYLGESDGCDTDVSSMDSQWNAAIQWTSFEADWKMLQSVHTLDNESIGNATRVEERNRLTFEVPGQPGSLLKHKWIIQSGRHGALVMDLTTNPVSDVLTDCADVCVCVVSGRQNAGLSMNCSVDCNSLALC